MENFVTASLHQVPQVAIHNSRFTALTVEIVLASPAPVQHVSHVLRNGFFYAAYCIDKSKVHLICSNGYMQGAKEQTSEAMEQNRKKQKPRTKARLETDTLWLS